jgi:pimeloyl-ACP methyl ester carboxylesterase
MIAGAAAVSRLNVVEYPVSAGLPRDTDAGRYQPVVLLHGIGGSAQSCAAVAERLAASGLTSWCVDAPGYGASVDPQAGDDLVADMIALLDALSPQRPVILLGTSWGGVVATAVALRRPDRVAGLVLADSTRGSGTTAEKAAAMRGRITEMQERGAVAIARERAPRLTAPSVDPAVADAVLASMSALRLPGFRAAAEFMAATDHGPRLSEIVCPTLVLVGEHDTVTGVEESRLLADAIPGARLHIIADAGHVAVQEQPDVVTNLVTEFAGGLP